MAEDQNPVEKAKVFNINEGIGKKGWLLPGAEAVAGAGGIPASVNINDIEMYAQCFEAVYKDFNPYGLNDLAKSIKVPPSAFSFSRISYMPEEYNSGVLQWPGIAPEAIRKIVRENLAPQLIIGQRVDDVMRYSTLSTHPWRPGWQIEHMNSKETISDAHRKDIREAESFIQNSNSIYGIGQARERDASQLLNFQGFLSQIVRDSLTFDGIAVWTNMEMQGKVSEYAPLPASQIRLVGPEGYEGNEKVFAVLVDEQNKVVHQFSRDELTWYVRNRRSQVDGYGYGLSEVETAIRLVQGFQNAIDLNIDTFNRCFSSDTEVLTKDGWKFFDQVEVDVDEFATLNINNGAFEYQKATDKIWHDYEGDMYEVKSRSLDFLVTPEHRIITQYRPTIISGHESPYVVTKAKDLFDKYQGLSKMSRNNYALPAISKWEGVEIGDKKFSVKPKHYGLTKGIVRSISGDDYCALLGMFLSEGNLARGNQDQKYNIHIHQQKSSKGYEPFRIVLKRIFGKEPNHYECEKNSTAKFTFGWWGLADHLSQFGSCCYDKHIPQEILDATPRQQKIFWDFYCLGDGCVSWSKSINGKRLARQEHITTTSKIMADQLQELAQKMGYAATICQTNPSKYASVIDGKVVKTTAIRYDVCLKRSPLQSMDMDKVHYSGKIGCVTVPNGTLYVRRNGKAIWSGNSAIPNGILVLSGGTVTQKQLDLLNRMWTNLKKGITKAWALPVIGLNDEKGKLELLDLSRVKGMEVYYQDFMNMLMGALCCVFRFPVRRLGYRISGAGKDTEPLPDSATQLVDDDDPGLAPLLIHLECIINEYLIWSRWPHLRFRFNGKSPKEDAREVEAKKLARTWGEERVEAGLPTLEEVAEDTELKDLAKILSLCPVDPAKQGVFQTLAGVEVQPEDTGQVGTPGARMNSKKDPATSQAHGHLSGTRRNSRNEKKK